jgi:hypothetical protein
VTFDQVSVHAKRSLENLQFDHKKFKSTQLSNEKIAAQYVNGVSSFGVASVN